MLSDNESLLIVRSQHSKMYGCHSDLILKARQRDLHSFWIYHTHLQPHTIKYFRKKHPEATHDYNNIWYTNISGGFGFTS